MPAPLKPPEEELYSVLTPYPNEREGEGLRGAAPVPDRANVLP